jgi:hypothetical protein
LRAARRNRRAVEIAGNNAGDLRTRVELDKASVEAFGFEEALIQRDVGRHVKAVAADHLADAHFGLLRLRADGKRKGQCHYCGGHEQIPERPHEIVLSLGQSRKTNDDSDTTLSQACWNGAPVEAGRGDVPRGFGLSQFTAGGRRYRISPRLHFWDHWGGTKCNGNFAIEQPFSPASCWH